MSHQSERPYSAFLSYSHKDREVALRLHRWLTRDAGFQIWFDERHLEAGSPVAARLAEEMSKCRNCILLVSKDSVESAWCKAERDQALHSATSSPDFKLVVLRIDGCNVGQVWPSMSRYNWIDLPDGILRPAVARDIIDRLDGRTWSGRQGGLCDVYVSRGWRQSDLPFADRVCEGLCANRFRLRLVGDAVDQPDFSEDRIREIMSVCGGQVVILPRRASAGEVTEKSYKYFLREAEIGASVGIPTILLAERDTPLPPGLAERAVRVAASEDYHRLWLDEPPDWLEEFLEELVSPPAPQHMFLAAEFKGSMEQVAQLREYMEEVTGMPCQIGRDFEGQGLREKIIAGISSASIFVANLASTGGESGVAELNFNTCIETGIAIGVSRARELAGKEPMPVLLVAPGSPEEKGKTSRLPFMFRDSQITWYASEAELLGHCRRLLLPYRRRVMNYEFAKQL